MNQLRKLIAKILYFDGVRYNLIFKNIEIQPASVQLIFSLGTSLLETILEHGQSVDGETGKMWRGEKRTTQPNENM